jgi:hypothetical protein
MRVSSLAFVVGALAAAAALPASAHHGWSGQDNAKVTVLEGPIKEVRYRNPHGEIDLVTADKQLWHVTLAPIARMGSRGLTEEQLKVGQTVKIEGHRNLDQARYEVKANSIAIGGKTTELR